MAARTIEIVHNGDRVAAHVRTSGNRQHTAVPEHLPASHRRCAGWTPGEIRRQVERTGPSMGTLVDLILRIKTHPEQGFRACLAILRLAKPHGRDVLEAACKRALEIGGTSYSSVASILKNNLHRHRSDPPAPYGVCQQTSTGQWEGPAITHQNIRGPECFH
ncbi:MAG: hypothetical protein AAGC57_19170 [Pseudomonadota bacterium]